MTVLGNKIAQSRPSQFCLKEGVMIHIANVLRARKPSHQNDSDPSVSESENITKDHRVRI